ncbi:MAG TPA: DUF547 domain-containing protein [Flavobacteriales bacterium]|nr:DUF547 domain-containing protein [Flavobacteriales bacterium]
MCFNQFEVIFGTFASNHFFMIRSILYLLLLTVITFGSGAQTISHLEWTRLLQKHVDAYGNVNYKGLMEDRDKLDAYLNMLSENPAMSFWKVEEQEAFWINAYNAFTIKLILDHYPVKSIKDIEKDGKDAWHIPFIKLGDKLYTLDYIENTMLRGQFNDSRIHFAINCSARSCPPLRNKAFTAENINIELRLVSRAFINDSRFNILSNRHVQISRIFEWYEADFLKEEPTINIYLNKNTPHLEIAKDASINYLNYNWDLNEK